MNIYFLQHETFEAPGAYLIWAQNRHHAIHFIRVFENDPLPTSVADIDLLIVMGGPQSPNTTQEECPYFNAKAEIELMQKVIQAGKKVIGVCLGAQLMGCAFGADVQRSPEREIGVFPITLTEAGEKNKNTHSFGKTLLVGHWHGDMPGITAKSKILAVSKGCPRQIIAFAPNAYGFQCHMELTKEVVEMLIESDPHQFAKSTFVQQPEIICQHDFSEMNQFLFQFLDEFTNN